MPGVSISPNKIQAYPIGDADITLQSLLENSIGWVVVSQSSASVFPRRAVISVDFPPTYTLNAGNASTLAVTYRDAASLVYTADANYRIEVLPVTRYDVKTAVEKDLLTSTQKTTLMAQLLYTTVLARRVDTNFSVNVAPLVVISVNVSNVRMSSAVGATGEHNVSVMTEDLAAIARGLIPAVYVGRPAEPKNVRMRNCQVVRKKNHLIYY